MTYLRQTWSSQTENDKQLWLLKPFGGRIQRQAAEPFERLILAFKDGCDVLRIGRQGLEEDNQYFPEIRNSYQFQNSEIIEMQFLNCCHMEYRNFSVNSKIAGCNLFRWFWNSNTITKLNAMKALLPPWGFQHRRYIPGCFASLRKTTLG